MAGPVYHFGDFQLDAGRFELLRNGSQVRLERKPLGLLILLASSQGRLVGRAEIGECLWHKEVFVDTEHGINTAIRKIRAALRDDPEKPRFIQTVPGMGYRFIAPTETINAPSPQEVQAAVPETVSAGSAEMSAPNRRAWIGVAAGTVLVVAGILVGTSHLAHGKTQQRIQSVAVLPLANYSGDSDQEYLADGMTDELVTMLAKDSTLRVVSRTSTMQYKGTARPLPEIARALHVDGILEGSVSRSNQQVHINLQLIRADTDTHLWAESYDRDVDDLAALPEEAASTIAARLKSASPVHSAARYVAPEAYDAYLRGRYFWSVGRNEEAGQNFERAVGLQPDFTLGWAGVSKYYAAGAFKGDLDPLKAMPKAIAAGRKAVELDDSSSQAHSVFAASIFFHDRDGAQALQEIIRAEELDPRSAETLHLHALVLSAMGRYDEAIAVQRRSTAIDPIVHPAAMAEILRFARRYDQALQAAQLRLPDFPEAKDLLFNLAEIYHWKGMDQDAAEMMARLYARHGEMQNPAVLSAFASGGYRAVVRWNLAELERLARSRYVSPVVLAHFHAELGEQDKTLGLLEQGFERDDPALLFIETDPAYDSLHTDRRYRDLLRRIGVTSGSPTDK